MDRSQKRRTQDDHILLPRVYLHASPPFSGRIPEIQIQHSQPDGRGIPVPQAPGSGLYHCVYRTVHEFIADRPDYALTYGEIVAMLDSREITLGPVEESYQEASVFGKQFAGSGGVAAAVLQVMRELGEDPSDIRLLQCSGGDECKKAMMLLKAGKLQEDFVEGMMCPGGCIGGPSKHQAEAQVLRDRKELLNQADGRKILENLEKYPMDQFSMFRDGHLDPSVSPFRKKN